MLRWWSLSYWRRHTAMIRHRERLALLLWPFLPDSARTEDNAVPLRLLVRVVRAIESGHDDFHQDEPAQRLWQLAKSQEAVQQAAGALRTVRLQLSEDVTAAGLQVEPIGRRQLKPLRDRMNADALDNAFSSWLHAPLALPLLSTLFLVSGWLFNAIFFSHFGLPVGRFFGLSDYLAASIEGLVPAAVAVAFTFFSQWLMRNRIRLQALQNQLGSSLQNLSLSVLTFAVAAPLVPNLFPDPPVQRLMFIYLASLALPMLAIPLVTTLSRKPARDTLLFSFVVIYIAVIWFIAEMRYISLAEKKKQGSEIILANAPDKPLSWQIISGNSLYLFLLNEQRDLVAVPVEQVLSVRYLAKKPEQPTAFPATTGEPAAVTQLPASSASSDSVIPATRP